MAEKSKKIYIDFQGGSHGNYLEFVCNRFLAGVPTCAALPFNHFNAAHKKQYLSEPLFESNHFTAYGIVLSEQTVISIHIDADDLLPLQCVSLLRAGDRDIRPEALQFDTYHKLNNADYQSVLDTLLKNFFNDRDFISGYQAIADSTWPQINSRSDYHALPEHIRRECEDVHGLAMNTLDSDHPDCPRDILVEFFKIEFMNPDQSGFIQTQAINIHQNCDVFQFPFACFYDEDKFITQIMRLADWLRMPLYRSLSDLRYLHEEFMKRQPYKDIKQSCDCIINSILEGHSRDVPELDVVQEAYVRARLTEHLEH